MRLALSGSGRSVRRHGPLCRSLVTPRALASGDPAHLAYALGQWEPVVPIAYDPRRVQSTITEFGAVVDAIEDNRFAPRSLEDLNAVLPGTRSIRFATRVCRQCDARYSCAAYRQYAWQPGYRGVAESQMRSIYAEQFTDAEQEEWRSAGLDAAPDDAGMRADFG